MAEPVLCVGPPSKFNFAHYENCRTSDQNKLKLRAEIAAILIWTRSAVDCVSSNGFFRQPLQMTRITLPLDSCYVLLHKKENSNSGVHFER